MKCWQEPLPGPDFAPYAANSLENCRAAAAQLFAAAYPHERVDSGLTLSLYDQWRVQISLRWFDQAQVGSIAAPLKGSDVIVPVFEIDGVSYAPRGIEGLSTLSDEDAYEIRRDAQIRSEMARQDRPCSIGLEYDLEEILYCLTEGLGQDHTSVSDAGCKFVMEGEEYAISAFRDQGYPIFVVSGYDRVHDEWQKMYRYSSRENSPLRQSLVMSMLAQWKDLCTWPGEEHLARAASDIQRALDNLIFFETDTGDPFCDLQRGLQLLERNDLEEEFAQLVERHSGVRIKSWILYSMIPGKDLNGEEVEVPEIIFFFESRRISLVACKFLGLPGALSRENVIAVEFIPSSYLRLLDREYVGPHTFSLLGTVADRLFKLIEQSLLDEGVLEPNEKAD